MKLENTLENKAKFFAQYWGQEVLIANPHVNQKNPFKCEQPYIYHNTDIAWLELTPLSHISDEDVIQGIMITYNKTYEDLGEILEVKHYDTFSSITTTRAGENFKTFRSFHHWNGNRKIGSMECDYLRSKGYALPWMDLSVEDLVEYGWVKLKEN